MEETPNYQVAYVAGATLPPAPLSMAEALNVAQWLKQANKERRIATIAGLRIPRRTLQVIELCRLVQQLTGQPLTV